MLGHFGLSYLGALYLLMLFIPNLIWVKHVPRDYDTQCESKTLRVLERMGQILVTATVLIFRDFNLQRISIWSVWLLASLVCMLLYEFAWVRYFASDNTEKNFYRSAFGIPVPLAVLPIIGFLLLGMYGRNPWLIGSVIVLGVGHIGIHIQHVTQSRHRR